ncbi:hypothetical protein E2C01_076139 [Portunus trituberculatus]|uniref:C-type lectin domain-containing protein n=1 Tax=Portunus trituberculatus TaxID=210409 RepID=A0A5B7IL94_PORTR|nr:hypothetical protein [Portunus trituberculatus]
MSPLPPSLPPLLALLELLAAAPPAAAEMSQAVWHRALVSQAQLDAAATSESFHVSHEILSAALANNAPWCHMLTYEGTTCVLYDVVVDSLDAAPDATTPCRTCYRNVCIVEGAPLPHGAKLVHDCFPSLCWNRAIIPNHDEAAVYPVSFSFPLDAILSSLLRRRDTLSFHRETLSTVSSTCDEPFSQTSAGCLYLYKQPTDWCKAHEYCLSLQSDLAIVSSEGFAALQDYFATEIPAEGKLTLVAPPGLMSQNLLIQNPSQLFIYFITTLANSHGNHEELLNVHM